MRAILILILLIAGFLVAGCLADDTEIAGRYHLRGRVTSFFDRGVVL